MPNQQLIDYINQSRQKGIADAQIRQELSAIGWSQSEIDEHLGIQANQPEENALENSSGGNSMKKCPYCAEEIQEEAVVCRYCKKELSTPSQQQVKNTTKKPTNLRKNFKWIGIAILALIAIKFWYILIPAIAIWYLWKKSKFDKRTKIIASITVLVFFLLLEGVITYSERTPTITIMEPMNGSSIQAQGITLKGEVSPAKSKVMINGKNIEVSKDGTFNYEMILPNEQNIANIQATNGDNLVTTSISITRIFTVEEKLELDRQKAEAVAAEQARLEAQRKAKAEADAAARAAHETATASAKAEQATYNATPAGRICLAHPSWTKDDCTKLANRKIWIGMKYEMLVYLFGKPDHTNVSNYGRGDEYQYCWNDYTPSCFYDNNNDGIIESYN